MEEASLTLAFVFVQDEALTRDGEALEDKQKTDEVKDVNIITHAA